MRTRPARRLDVCAAGLVVVLFALVCLAWDRAAHARIHPAFLWGGLFLIVSLPLRFAIGGTAAWGALAEWLTQ